ncbi:MAG: DUF3995 domain-containing protein [Bacteroidota bacterium]
MIFTTVLSFLLSLIFLLLGSLHFYWVFGGRWGLNNALPQTKKGEKVMLPGLLPTIIVGSGLCSFALFYLVNLGWFTINLPEWTIKIASWGIPIIFLLRAIGDFKYAGLFKKIKQTDFAKWDNRLYTPLCLFIGILGVWVAIF